VFICRNWNVGYLQYFKQIYLKGWRKTMEDTFIMNADLTDDCSVFGIFDGHGGREVALYVEKHFIEEFSKN
jgi:serine/threonine protein phosphatase PrpC